RERARQRVLDDLVDQADAPRVLGTDGAPGEQQVHRVHPAHLAGQQDGGVAAGEEAERHLGPVERRAWRAVADVGREQHVGAAGEAVTLDRRDQRLLELVAGEQRVGRPPERLEAVRRDALAARLVASTSIVIVTSSPTATPPASSVWFQAMPKSLRSILAVACAPARVLPHGSLMSGVGPSTSRTTGWVTPCSVRSPLTLKCP